jgi:hypothetical protein
VIERHPVQHSVNRTLYVALIVSNPKNALNTLGKQ